MAEYSRIATGSTVSNGVTTSVVLPFVPNFIEIWNPTQAAAAAGGVSRAWWTSDMGTGTAQYVTTSVGPADGSHVATTGGFSIIQAGLSLQYGPVYNHAVGDFSISTANPAVVTTTVAHGLVTGNVIIFQNLYQTATTGMAQIGGMAFTVSSASTTGFTLLGLPAAGFAAAATAVTSRRIYQYNQMLPEFMYVTAISQASQAVVTVSVDPTNLVYVGQKLVFQIPQSFGMTQLTTAGSPGTQDLPAVVTAVNYAAYQFTINVNTSAYTPFAFPASTLSPTSPLFATVAPAGSSTQYIPSLQTYTGYDFTRQPFRSSQQFPLMNLQAGAQSPAGSSGDIIVYQAWKAPVTVYSPGA